MIYNKNANLTGQETLQRILFRPPQNSLVEFAYDKIHHFKTYRILKYHYVHSDVMTRLYALIIPIFAFLDTIQFAGKSIYQFITLNHESGLYNVCNCAKAFQVFLVTSLMWIPSIIAPTHFLRDERFWVDIQQAATIKKVEDSEGFKAIENGPEQLELILKDQVSKFILEEDTRALCNECIKTMIDSLPQDLDRGKLVVSSYVRMTANFLVTTANKNVNFTQKEEFLILFKELVHIQDPEFKEDFLRLMLTHHSSVKELIAPVAVKEIACSSLILTFLLRSLIDSEEDIIKTSDLFSHKYFIDSLHQRTFFKALLSLYEAGLTKEQNNHLLKSCVLLFPAPQPAKDPKEPSAKFKNRKSKITRKLEKNKEKAAALKQRLETLPTGDATLKDKVYQLYKNASTQLSDLEQAIRVDETTLAVGENADKVTSASSDSDITRGFQNLTIILRLPSKEMVASIIDSLSLNKTDDKRYKSLSDDEILKDLFIKVFSFEQQSSQNLKTLWELRAPEALLKFHLRLMEYRGSDRDAVLAKSKEIVLSILSGTFWQTRFKTENNPHLKQIFDSRSDIMAKWLDEHPKSSKVTDLIPNASGQFKDCEITLSKDPSDILLIGDDLRHCLNLNGRLTRVPGLLAFLADGKTHMMVAKSNNKGPSLAQTVIILLWDETKNQPVLLLEETFFKGKEARDYTLENASIAYAKQMAKDLGVELVVCHCGEGYSYKNNDPNNPVVAKPYEGSIVSLPTSSPIEYVYSFNAIVKPPYALERCYAVVE